MTPSEVVYEEGHIRVLHYLNGAPKHSPPLLLVFALVNRPYILDLKEGRSVVSHFVQSGFDTYLLDWGVPTAADRYLLSKITSTGIWLTSWIISASVMTPKLEPARILHGRDDERDVSPRCIPSGCSNLILLAAGIDFAMREGLLNLWTDPKYFDVDRFVDAYGNCPPEFLQASFQMLKPVQNLLEKPINFFERVDDDEYVDDFFTMETWLNDNIPVPGEVFRRFVKDLYQKNLLVQDRLRMGRRMVNLRDITCPILNLMAKADDLVPCSQAHPSTTWWVRRTVPASRCRRVTSGSRWVEERSELWPKACRWLQDRSESSEGIASVKPLA